MRPQPPPLSCRGGDVVKFVLHLAEAIKQALQRGFLQGWEGTAGQCRALWQGTESGSIGWGGACLLAPCLAPSTFPPA